MKLRSDWQSRLIQATLAVALVPSSVLLTAAATGPIHRLKTGESWRPRGIVDAPGVNGVALLQGNISDAQIGPARVRGAYRAVETAGGSVLRNIRIEGLTATDLQRDGVRLRGSIDGLSIRNFNLRMRERPQSRPHLPEGIAVATGRNITITDGTISGFRLAAANGRYPNGDGIAAERPVSNLRIERVEANDNADGGFDLKSQDTRLDKLTARRNFRNYRFWGGVTAGTLTSVDPRSAHVWAGRGAVVHIDRLVASSSTKAALLKLEGAREVVIDRCELRLPRGTPIVQGNQTTTRVKLGAGCRI